MYDLQLRVITITINQLAVGTALQQVQYTLKLVEKDIILSSQLAWSLDLALSDCGRVHCGLVLVLRRLVLTHGAGVPLDSLLQGLAMRLDLLGIAGVVLRLGHLLLSGPCSKLLGRLLPDLFAL